MKLIFALAALLLVAPLAWACPNIDGNWECWNHWGERSDGTHEMSIRASLKDGVYNFLMIGDTHYYTYHADGRWHDMSENRFEFGNSLFPRRRVSCLGNQVIIDSEEFWKGDRGMYEEKSQLIYFIDGGRLYVEYKYESTEPGAEEVTFGTNVCERKR